VQREVARIALAGMDGLPWPGRARSASTMIERPTEDVDLFTTSQEVTAFGVAVDQVAKPAAGSGFQAESRRATQFARLHVVIENGLQLDADLDVDWRQMTR
jgi:hypothetical protein